MAVAPSATQLEQHARARAHRAGNVGAAPVAPGASLARRRAALWAAVGAGASTRLSSSRWRTLGVLTIFTCRSAGGDDRESLDQVRSQRVKGLGAMAVQLDKGEGTER